MREHDSPSKILLILEQTPYISGMEVSAIYFNFDRLKTCKITAAKDCYITISTWGTLLLSQTLLYR